MLNYDETILKRILIEELGWSNIETTDLLCQNMHKVDSRLQNTLDAWFLNRSIINEVEVQGVTISQIMDKEDIGFIDALLTMDIFLEDVKFVNAFIKTPKNFFGRM